MPQARRRTPLASPARRVAALAVAASIMAASLAGCAEVHRGVEAVGRVGSQPAGPVEVEVAPAVPARAASAVPSPRDIFDFHPAGARPDSWRQPFVIDSSDGPLAGDVRRTAAELRAFLAGHDRVAVAAPKGCSETDVAVGKPGCGQAARGPRTP